MTGIEAVAAGQELPAITRTFTRADLVRYAGASGDFNPIHWSNQAAAALGLPDVIVHGMLTMGTALRVVDAGDPGGCSATTSGSPPVVVPEADGTDVRFAGRVTKVEDGVATVSIEAIAGEVAVLRSAVAEVSVA